MSGWFAAGIQRERAEAGDKICPTSRSCERRVRQRLMGLAVRSASHSLSLGLRRQPIMALRQVAIPAAQAVQLVMHWGRGVGLVHGDASRLVPRGKLRLLALGNGPRECELAVFNREIMALRGITESFAGFVTRQVHRERDYLSRASRWSEQIRSRGSRHGAVACR